MSQDDGKSKSGLMKIHAMGVASCALIAFGSIWFAADSVSKRRGLFLSARHELTTAKSELNSVVAARSTLFTQVQSLEKATADQLKLVSVRQVNARSAEIVGYAEQAGVSVDSLQPLEMILDARVPVQPLEFSATAQADQAADLLNKLDQAMPDIHIQTIQMISENLGTDKVRIRMLMYWFIDPADKG